MNRRMLSTPRPVALALLGTLTLLTIVGVGAGRRAGWFSRHPNVILITLDTTRADRLGCYGHSQARTPTIDRLAREGVVFQHASSPAPLTLPVHASLFTGLYPLEHGLRTNGRGSLPRELPTLAERLRDNGYDTAAFVASFVLHSKFGLDRGFATYDDDLSTGQATSDSLQRQRDGANVVDSALRWLNLSRRQPAFCWVHLYDPHAPYLTREESFGDEFRDRPYDAEIAYIDRQVARIIETVTSGSSPRDTLVILVGDHGEGLGDHVEREHGQTLYESTQRVPMIWWSPRRIPAEVRPTSRVSLVDVAPTLLDLLRIVPLPEVSGRSVRPAWEGGTLPAQPVFAMTDEPYLQNAWCPVRSFTTDRWKYIRTTAPELYDLQADPDESVNLIAEHPDKAQEFESQVIDWETRMTKRLAGAVELSAEERRRLTSLGYLGGGESTLAPDDVFSRRLPDVKTMLPIDIEVYGAVEWLLRGRSEDAARRLQDVLRRESKHVAARVFLGEALEAVGQYDQALAAYESALDLRPDHIDAWLRLSNLAIRNGDWSRAEEILHKLLVLDSESAEAHYNLGVVQRRLGRTEEAYRSYQDALRCDPWLLNAHAALGTLHAEAGHQESAVAAFRSELELNPRSSEAEMNLGVILARRGEHAQGLAHISKGAKLAPKSAAAHYNLGAFLAGQGRSAEARQSLRRALDLDPQHTLASEELQRLGAATSDD